MLCGCVIFDEARPESGWASIDGGQAFNINGVGDLSSDVFWWTSLDVANFYHVGLGRMANMRNEEFLRGSMKQIRDELGLTPRYTPVNHAVTVLSELFSRVMNLGESHYGIKTSRHQRYCEDLRAALIPNDTPISEEMDTAAMLAYQTFVSCTRNPGRTRTRSLLFKRNRYLHARDVMSTPVPGPAFEYVQRERLPPKNERLKWLLGLDQPVLVEGAVSSVATEFSNVIAFGGGSKYRRRWISHPELIALSPYADFDIESVFLFNEYQQIQTRIPAPEVPPGIGMLSMSIGILAENFWAGIASPQILRMSGNKKLYSPRAAWMRAADRCFTMIPAMHVHAAGIQVSSYSVGSVAIDVPFGNLSDVVEVAGAAGLFPPMTVSEDSMMQEELA